jgi:uncharacterized protein (DUF934 family)
MPRRLLRDGVLVEDDWRYAAGSGADGGPRLIIPFDQWTAERDRWLLPASGLGVLLEPAHRVEDVATDLARFSLVAAHFTGPSEGRGYTQARLLRERWKFTGELRAMGYVRLDQIFFMARCGFNSFELPESDWAEASRAFATFSATYQSTNDAGLAVKLAHR